MLGAYAGPSRARSVKRVLVLGGYGGFGARLSRRLAGDGWDVLVAGRNAAKARVLAEELTGARGIVADRNGDLDALLAEHQPDLLMDAAGPFQNSNYRVVEACIAAGVHYCDLADARDFVCGISEFDEAARAAGVTVISGGSSVPALSGAVVRELTREMERVTQVEMSICTSAEVTAGRSLAEAGLSYAGQPIRMRAGGRRSQGFGWHHMRRVSYAVPGRAPITRSVALVDIPDLEITPAMLPGKPATSFRGGTDSVLQMIGLWLIAWPVRWGWMRSAVRWAGLLGPIQRVMSKLGGAKSGMKVEVAGFAQGQPMIRRWTLLAEQSKGAEIPTLASQLVARRLQAGGLEAGAYDSSQLFSLADFETLFADLPVYTHGEESHEVPVYRTVMGAAFDALPEPVREMHNLVGNGGASGSGTVVRGSGILAQIVGRVMGFPPAGEYPVHVDFTARDGVERWTRQFGEHRFHSHLSASGNRIIERFGPMRFAFDLPVNAEGLIMVLRRWTFLGIPMPLALGPKVEASERADGEDFIFDVQTALPLIGPIVSYHGRLRKL